MAWSTIAQIGYCSVADIEKKIGKQRLAELTNDGFTQGISNEGAEPDEDVCNLLITQAGQDIDSIVGMRYSVPFALDAIPNSIKFICIDLVAYYAYKRKIGANKITADWQKTYDDAICDLEAIASGNKEIGIDANSQAATIIDITSLPQVQFFNADNPMSNY